MPQKIVSENKSYKVLKKLGEGGTSVVYLVEDSKKRKLALKILGEEVDPAFLDRIIDIMKNEFEVLSKLRHSNIAQVFDFEFCPELGKYFFTTEYVEGTDILTFTEHADFATKEELIVQFLNALEYVHRSGLIHCDIKCGNILVTSVKDAPVIKLVDFGFATRHLATDKIVVGTLHYLAPELVLKMAGIDNRVDIYASGIVLYRL
ncbi:serine/threonine protein kinase, partial [bacterium]|nr:serine/threonine protein kinase [bacterium]